MLNHDDLHFLSQTNEINVLCTSDIMKTVWCCRPILQGYNIAIFTHDTGMPTITNLAELPTNSAITVTNIILQLLYNIHR